MRARAKGRRGSGEGGRRVRGEGMRIGTRSRRGLRKGGRGGGGRRGRGRRRRGRRRRGRGGRRATRGGEGEVEIGIGFGILEEGLFFLFFVVVSVVSKEERE